MDSEIIVAIIGSSVTVVNVAFTTIANAIAEKRRRKEAAEMRQDNRITLLENGVQSLLRAEIIRSHEKYMSKGFCPVYAREALARAYEAYHGLGGNGTMTELYRQCTALPTDEEVHDD